jgi:hypothetical protein
MRSLTSRNDPNAVCIEERKTLTLGSSISYATFHQKGTEKMAARPEIQLTESFKRATMKHIQTYLVEIATKSGFRTGLGPIESSSLGAAVQRTFSPGATLPRHLGGRTHHPAEREHHEHERRRK